MSWNEFTLETASLAVRQWESSVTSEEKESDKIH